MTGSEYEYARPVIEPSDDLRERMLPMEYDPAPAPQPRELPDLRVNLASLWDDGGLFRTVMIQKHEHDQLARLVPYASLFDGKVYSSWEQRTLRTAHLWWVAEPMCRLLFASMNGVPADVMFDDLPEPTDPGLRAGFAVFETPFPGHSAEDGADLPVSAVLWGPVRLPPIVGHPGGVDGMAVSSYGSFQVPDDGTGTGAQQVYRDDDGGQIIGSQVASAGDRLWWPQGRTDWPLTDPLGTKPWPMDDTALASYTEDRRLLAALWTLLHQRGIATTSLERQARPIRRRTQRAGLPTTASDVRLVTLRVIGERGEHEPTGSETHYSVRWPVQGHWRNARVGPGRSERRLVYVNPYIKGPEGKPLKEAAVVRVWKR